jgi:flagella basal body P-ring formation protein FlgA
MNKDSIARRAKYRRAGARFLAVSSLFLAIGLLTVPAVSAPAASWSPESTLHRYILQHYPWAEADISDLQLSATPPSYQPSSVTVEKAPPGRARFRLEFEGGRSVIATAFIKVFDRVVMSRSAFPRGYVLKQDDVYSTLMESGRIPRGAIRAEDQAVGKPLYRSIVPNMPLTSALVSETPLVKRGRKVVICVESPAFSIKAGGELTRDAAVGDYVKTVNLMSKKIITGLLIDENTVRVEY